MGLTRAKVVGLCAALGALIAPAAVAAAKPPSVPRPDLKVVKLEVSGVGEPPNLVVSHDGTVPRFGVSITIRNQGHAAAKPSTAAILIDDGAEVPVHFPVTIGKIPAGGRADKFVQVTGLKPHLGFTEIAAVADFSDKNKESDESNNRKNWPGKIAVEARQWNVNDLLTVVSTPGAADAKTESQPGFRFRLTKFDDASESFQYQALGDINNHQTQSGICAFGVGNTQTKTPWPDSFLHIKADLENYDALVKASKAATYTGTITCLGGFSYNNTFHFDDLETGPSLPHMTPGSGHLDGIDSDTALHTGWSWKFVADVPPNQMD